MKLAGSRYQKTFNGKCKHAARQGRYRKKKNQIVEKDLRRRSLYYYNNNQDVTYYCELLRAVVK